MPINRFYTTEQLSDNVGKTQEGFLVLYGVPIARQGLQVYSPEEVPSDIEPNADCIVYIEREPEDVFHQKTIASINGKPFCNDHPQKNGQRVDITPENYREFACGTTLNARRGEGVAADDLLFADIVVTDPQTIDDILKKRKYQISCGYDAEYTVLEKGRAKQTAIRVNHIALVEEGRCGPRCSIRDKAHRCTDACFAPVRDEASAIELPPPPRLIKPRRAHHIYVHFGYAVKHHTRSTSR